MLARQVVLLLTAAVLLLEADLLAQRTPERPVGRVFALCVLPLLAVCGLVVYRRWKEFQ